MSNQVVVSNKKPLGFWMALSLVIGNMIGAGIFLAPAALAVFGSISIWSWVIGAIGIGFMAIVFSNLNKQLPHTGGAFLYSYHAYGEFVGFTIAASYWFAWCIGNATMAVAFIGYLNPFIPILREHNPHFSPLLAFFVKISVIWLLTIVNILGIKLVGRVQLITVILKILPLMLIAVVGIFKIKLSNLTGYYNISGQSDLSALTGAAVITFWSFQGFESAVVPADDITSSHTITRATLIGTFITAIVYISTTIVLLGLFPATVLKHSASPFADAAVILFGHHASLWIAACAIIAIVGTLNGSLLVQTQDAMAAADHALFPKIFAKRNRFNTPAMGFFISACAITLVLLLTVNQSLLKQFNFLLLLSSFGYLVPYFVSTTADLILNFKRQKKINYIKLFYSSLIALFASLYAFWMFIGTGEDTVFYGCLFFFALFWLHWIFKITQMRKKYAN